MRTNEQLLAHIVSERQAYLLGLIAAAGQLREDHIRLELRGKTLPLDRLLRARSPSDIPIERRQDRSQVTLAAPGLVEDVVRHLGAWTALDERRFPDLVEEELRWAFARGLFDAAGRITAPSTTKELECRLSIASRSMRSTLSELTEATTRADSEHLYWRGTSALDFLGKLYERAKLCSKKHRERYWAWCHTVPHLRPKEQAVPKLVWRAVKPEAHAPTKHRSSDSGYDLTLIDQVKRIGPVTLYGTGVQVEPPFGWYFDVIARSSIIKTGYMVANSVGVIDRGYRGEIMVPLVKLDPAGPDLVLPARVVQLVPRPIVHFETHEVQILEHTLRGIGGFGSTG